MDRNGEPLFYHEIKEIVEKLHSTNIDAQNTTAKPPHRATLRAIIKRNKIPIRKAKNTHGDGAIRQKKSQPQYLVEFYSELKSLIIKYKNTATQM